MVDYNGVATTTEHGGELRRERARCCGLPSLVSEHGREQWVAEALVEALQGWRSSEGELALATATAGL